MKTAVITTKKKNELYEYAKKFGFKFDEWNFSPKGDLYSQAFKKRTFEVNGHEYHVQHTLNSCLYTAGKYVMSIATTIYNTRGRIEAIKVVMPISSQADIDNALKKEENLIAFAKKSELCEKSTIYSLIFCIYKIKYYICRKYYKVYE